MSDCLFCKIASGETPADKIHEDDEIVAFRDINAQAPTHFLVIPRQHIESLSETKNEHQELLGRLLLTCRRLAEAEGIGSAFRVVNNCGARAGQSVFHVHFHVLGGRDMSWPPG